MAGGAIGGGQDLVVGRGLVEILPDFKKWGRQLAADMKAATSQLDNTSGRFKKTAAGIGSAMATAGKGASLVGLGVAVAATKMAGDFQKETAVLQTAAGETSKGLGVVREGIKNIAQGTGTGIKNLTDGMYTIEKAGFRGASGLKILKAAAQGAREENANLADVTNAMTSIMASYHLKAGSAVNVMNAMKTAAGEGKITMEEFSGALSTVLPIASANKISLAQVAGSMATLTQHGTTAREATHELAATIRALASPNNVASREMARFGLSSVDVAKNLGARGLSGTINLLVNTILKQMGPAGIGLQKTFEGTKQSAEDARIMMSKMSPSMKELATQFKNGSITSSEWGLTLKSLPVDQANILRQFATLINRSRGFSRELKSGGPAAHTFTDALKKMSGGAIGLDTILQLTGESAKGNADRIRAVGKSFKDNSKDVEGWKITQNLLNVQLDMAKERLQVLAIDIGTKLIPVVVFIVKLFTEHKTVTMLLVGAILAFIGALSAAYVISKAWAVGTAVVTAAMFAFNVVTMAQTDSLAVLRGQMALLWIQERMVALWTAITSTAFWGLAAAILANPLTWIVVAIVAVVAGIVLLATKTRFFQTIWAATWGFVKKVFFGFMNWFKKNWQLITFTILTLGIGLAVAEIVRHWKGVKHAFSETIDWVKHNWPLLLAILGGPIGLAVLYIVKHWSQVTHTITQGWNDIWKGVVAFGSALGSFFSKLPGQLGRFFSSLPGTIGHWFVVAGTAIGDFFSKLPGRMMSQTNKFNNVLINAGKDLISGLFHGATVFFTQMIPSFFKTLWHGIVDYFKAVFGIHSPSTVMAELGVQLLMGLLKGMLAIATTIGSWLNTHVFGPVTHFFTNAGNWLISQGKNVITGFIRGNFAVAATLHGWMNDHVYRPMVNFFSNAIAWLVPGGRSTISGLINGAKNMWNSMTSWLSGRRAAVAGYFSGAASWLSSAGHDVISGLWSGMKGVWSALTGWIGGIAKWIKDHKGPISLDSRLLTPAGKAIMGGLLSGLQFGFKGVGNFVYHVGDSIASGIGKVKGLIASIGASAGLGTPGAAKGAQQYAQLYMKTMGWGPSQWGALKALWMGESGWNARAYNASSGATGIPQALPGSKMASEGSDWRTNAATQIRWGEKYIRAVYGTPAHAYAKWLSRKPHWYDQGGIASHIGAIFKNTNKPERILSPRQTEAFERLVDHSTRRGGGGGTTVVNAHFHNHSIIGSKHEMENWLVDSFDQLQRRGRIRVITRPGT